MPRLSPSLDPVGKSHGCASNYLRNQNVPPFKIKSSFDREVWCKPPFLVNPTTESRGESQGKGSQEVPAGTTGGPTKLARTCGLSALPRSEG